ERIRLLAGVHIVDDGADAVLIGARAKRFNEVPCSVFLLLQQKAATFAIDLKSRGIGKIERHDPARVHGAKLRRDALIAIDDIHAEKGGGNECGDERLPESHPNLLRTTV